MICFPNAKINLGLYITARRDDGYHDLETAFYPVALCDALESIPADKLSFTTSGIPVPGDGADNLCMKAYRILAGSYDLPPVHIHLHKQIPMGAGLGGGSADAAFLLVQLNKQFELGISDHDLELAAGTLGADCPFFIRNVPVLATGRGDRFEPLQLDLSAYKVVIVMPDIHVSTADAFRGVVPKQPPHVLADLLAVPASRWRGTLHNQFEDTVIPKFPVIAAIKEALYESGAVYASMTGSGAAVYGLFHTEPDLTKIERRHRVFRPAPRIV